MTERDAATHGPRRAPTRWGLSGKLLVLTILFVMIAEVLIYVPSIANFRLNWLQDRLSAAYTAALVFETAPEGKEGNVSDNVARQILESIGARAVALKIGPDPESKKPTALFDMRGFSSWAREDRPARIVFGADRRPELIASSLILGTSITINLRSPGISSSG